MSVYVSLLYYRFFFFSWFVASLQKNRCLFWGLKEKKDKHISFPEHSTFRPWGIHRMPVLYSSLNFVLLQTCLNDENHPWCKFFRQWFGMQHRSHFLISLYHLGVFNILDGLSDFEFGSRWIDSDAKVCFRWYLEACLPETCRFVCCAFCCNVTSILRCLFDIFCNNCLFCNLCILLPMYIVLNLHIHFFLVFKFTYYPWFLHLSFSVALQALQVSSLVLHGCPQEIHTWFSFCFSLTFLAAIIPEFLPGRHLFLAFVHFNILSFCSFFYSVGEESVVL